MMEHLPEVLRAIDRDVRIAVREDVGRVRETALQSKRHKLFLRKVERLSRIGEIYDLANHLSTSARKDESLVSNRYALFAVVAENHDAIHALTNQDTKRTAELLLESAPFLAKLYLNLLANDSRWVDILTRLKAGTKDYEGQKKDLEDLVDTARVMVSFSREYGNWTDKKLHSKEDREKEAEEILNTQLKVVKNHFKLHFIRLGALYIPSIRNPDQGRRKTGSGARKKQDDMQVIFDEMSHFSNAMLSVVTRIVGEYFARLYGNPNSEFAILLGGANARKEFPSFDYDAIAVYGKDGKTDNTGIKKPVERRLYFHMMFKRIMYEMNDIGLHMKPNFHEFIVWYNFQKKITRKYLVPALNTLKKQLKRRHGKMIYVPLSNLILGAGSEKLKTEIIDIIREHILEGSGFLDSIARALSGRRDRDEEWEKDKSSINIKRSPGGLRDINEAIWIHSVGKIERESESMLEGIQRLPIAGSEKRALKKAYLYLINLRIRMDLYYGRNEKDLPRGEALNNLAVACGYSGDNAGEKLRKDTQKYMGHVRTITDNAVDHCYEKNKGLRRKVAEIRKMQRGAEQYWSRVSENRVREQDEERREIERRLRMLGANVFTLEAWRNKALGERGGERH